MEEVGSDWSARDGREEETKDGDAVLDRVAVEGVEEVCLEESVLSLVKGVIFNMDESGL